MRQQIFVDEFMQNGEGHCNLRSYHCAGCGKEFCVQDFAVYAWKFNGKSFCSYTCRQRAKREYESKHKIIRTVIK